MREPVFWVIGQREVGLKWGVALSVQPEGLLREKHSRDEFTGETGAFQVLKMPRSVSSNIFSPGSRSRKLGRNAELFDPRFAGRSQLRFEHR